VNEGIVEAHRQGILTATTLMANGDAFEDAVRLSRQTPSLDVGCHLVLVQGMSVLEPDKALPATPGDLVRKVMFGRLRIYDELAAQVRKIVAAGIAPTHLDTHKHTQVLPQVLRAAVRVAREFGIPWLRCPLSLRWGFGSIRTTDHFTGFRMTGSLNTETLIAELGNLPDGLTELMCHPGRLGPELRNSSTRLKESRAIELEALTSPRVSAVLRQGGIRLVNYRDSD
jgi:predicted glycoside hydrolase/deacetylase ChbG (UPF0249 family)